MSLYRYFSYAAAALVLAQASPSLAQKAGPDLNAAPNFQTVRLSRGFTPDPHRVSLRSGGDIDASTISNSCRGFISRAPDVRLELSGSGSLPLIISAAAESDTTLVINAPDGSWHCNDDGENGLNPSYRFSNPTTGRYEIWVGTYGGTELRPAELHISELYTAAAVTQASSSPAQRTGPDLNADPNYGTVRLSRGFTPDPHRVSLRSGGDIDASTISSSCGGFISRAPDVRLILSGSGSLPLIISAASESDTTLVINAPDGSWYCNDDGGNELNPSYRFSHPTTGRYEIWVGTYGGTELRPAELQISELYSR